MRGAASGTWPTRAGEDLAGAVEPPPIADHPAHRVRSLDALRGIAALLVVLGHYLEQSIRQMAAGDPVVAALHVIVIDYLNFGRTGVVAFFMVSGYVIPFSFSHRSPVRSFLIARFFRLYPAYWISITGVVALALVLTQRAPSDAQIAVNLTMLQAVLGQKDLIGVYWTLFYELLFYGLCMGAFLIRRMEDPRYLLVVVGGLSIAGCIAAYLRGTGTMSGVPIGLPMFLAIMHLGTLVRLHDRGDGARATTCFRAGLAIVLLTAGPISAFGFQQHAADQRLIADVTSLYVGIALFMAMRRAAWAVRAPLLFLGLISYSLYLFHPLILDAVVAATASVAAAIRPILILLCVPTGAIVVSALVQRFVEQPANRLGKAVRQRVAAG